MLDLLAFVEFSTRLSFGFPQPNAAGAFFALLGSIPCVSFIVDRNPLSSYPVKLHRGWFFLVLGTLSMYALLLTQSRGAFVSFGFTLILVTTLLCIRFKEASIQYLNRLFIWAGLLLFLSISTGFTERIEPETLIEGASTRYRLELWRSGLNMIFLKPFFGWGVDQSGTIYMHWFQQLDSSHQVAGMINSYLHIASERGLIKLVLYLTPILLLLGYHGKAFTHIKNSSSTDSYSEDTQHLIHIALISIFLLTNIFSTLWLFWQLWVLPVAYFAFSAYLYFRRTCLAAAIGSVMQKLPLLASAAALLSMAIALTFWSLGFSIHKKVYPRIHSTGPYLQFRGALGKGEEAVLNERWYIAGHPSVFHKDYGKQIRKFIASSADPKVDIWVPQTSRIKSIPTIHFDRIIFLGKAAQSLSVNSKLSTDEVIFINPFFDRVPSLPARTKTVLISGDFRNSAQIERWKTYTQAEDSIELIWMHSVSDSLDDDWIEYLQAHLGR